MSPLVPLIEGQLRPLPNPEADVLRLAGYILCGMRHLPGVIERGYNRGHQAEIHDGRLEEAQRRLLRIGARRLGKPEPFRPHIEAWLNRNALEALHARLHRDVFWRELLN